MTTTDGRSQLRKRGREVVIPTQALILRFRIELQRTDPLLWREIDVPGDYSFWDLHVAIQDAMGWQDYHLHRFTIPHPRTKKEQIFGIHDLYVYIRNSLCCCSGPYGLDPLQAARLNACQCCNAASSADAYRELQLNELLLCMHLRL
jgi:hypothetical protein